MRNIESSPWLTQPELVEIKSVPVPGARDKDAPRVNEFTLNVPAQARGAAARSPSRAAAPGRAAGQGAAPPTPRPKGGAA